MKSHSRRWIRSKPHFTLPENMAVLSATATHLPFISQDLKVGGVPPRSDWAAFEQPRLRRFPDPDGIRLKGFLGRGREGFVFRAETRKGCQVAVKFVRSYVPAYLLTSTTT